MQIIKTILADDHFIFLEGLKSVLSKSTRYQFEIVGTARAGKDLLHLIHRNPADLLISELNLATIDGLEVLHTLQRERSALRILILTMYDNPKFVKEAMKAGAHGYILKDQDVEEFFQAIHQVMSDQTFLGEGVHLHENGHQYPVAGKQATDFHVEDRFTKKYNLTKRELEILRLISQAMSNKQIAHELFISDQTVSVHRKNIMKKLGVNNAAGLIKVAYDFSLV